MSTTLTNTALTDINTVEKELPPPPPYSFVDDAAKHLQTFETKITAMSSEDLRTKVRENGINLLRKPLTKLSYITILNEAFNKYCTDIKNKTRTELCDICRDHKISGFTALKKDELAQTIIEVTASCSKVQFVGKMTTDSADKSTTNETDKAQAQASKTNNVEPASSSNTFISELELMKKKLYNQIEKEKEKEKEKERLVEKERLEKIKLEKETLKLEQERLKAEKEKEKANRKLLLAQAPAQAAPAQTAQTASAAQATTSDEDQEKKKKKQTIPKSVKTHVWDLYIGKHINEHRCLCCKKAYIQITNFDTGHVISEKDGGTHEISNLRPICAVCNHSMGSENMIDFVKRYGYYIG